jgi:hypothetical protein
LQLGAASGNTHEVLFQFPPRILSDNRKGSWKEGDLRGKEPVAVFKTSGPREISLSWTYIVDGQDFTTAVIAEEVHAIRGYFAQVRDKKARARNLIVMFKYILFGGQQPMSARIKSIDVKHGDTIICPPGEPEQSFPLRTDITIDLRLWTKGGDEEATQDLADLKEKLTPEWY